MKTTIDLPESLVREAKLRAVMQGRSLKDLIADYIRQGLVTPRDTVAPPLPQARVQLDSLGLPVIHGRKDAPATRSTVDELLELEQRIIEAEDLRASRVV